MCPSGCSFSDQDYFIDVCWLYELESCLWHHNIKGNEDHLGYSVLLTYPLPWMLPLGVHCKSYLVCGEDGEDSFPQLFASFLSFRPVRIASDNFESPLDVMENMFLLLCWLYLLSVVYTMFRVSAVNSVSRIRTEISRKITTYLSKAG